MIQKNKKTTGELVYGIHPVTELLKAKRRKIISIYTTKPHIKAWKSIEKELPSYPHNIQYVARDVLTRMAGTSDHQGIIAWTQAFPVRKKMFDSDQQPFLLMLDGVQDVGNLGAILRSAYCAGVDGIVLLQKNAAPLNAAVFKASAGLAEHLEIYYSASAQSAVQELQQAGYSLCMAAFGGKNAFTYSYQKPVCVVIGNEAVGISKDILSKGTIVSLPQRNTDISYNASVAAGALLMIIGSSIGKI